MTIAMSLQAHQIGMLDHHMIIPHIAHITKQSTSPDSKCFGAGCS